MLTPKPKDFLLLLEVFRLGLPIGLVSKDEVIAWADDIINKADEPEYFFIELSLGNSINNLIQTLNRHIKALDDPICVRVILSCVYRQVMNKEKPLAVETVAKIVGDMFEYDYLSEFEINQIYNFGDYGYYHRASAQLRIDITDFLSIYKRFTINNYHQWNNINAEILIVLKERQHELYIANEVFRKIYKRKERKRLLRQYLKVGAVIIVVLGLLYVLSKFVPSFFTGSPTWLILLFYLLVKAGIALINNKKRRI